MWFLYYLLMRILMWLSSNYNIIAGDNASVISLFVDIATIITALGTVVAAVTIIYAALTYTIERERYKKEKPDLYIEQTDGQKTFSRLYKLRGRDEYIAIIPIRCTNKGYHSAFPYKAYMDIYNKRLEFVTVGSFCVDTPRDDNGVIKGRYIYIPPQPGTFFEDEIISGKSVYTTLLMFIKAGGSGNESFEVLKRLSEDEQIKVNIEIHDAFGNISSPLPLEILLRYDGEAPYREINEDSVKDIISQLRKIKVTGEILANILEAKYADKLSDVEWLREDKLMFM